MTLRLAALAISLAAVASIRIPVVTRMCRVRAPLSMAATMPPEYLAESEGDVEVPETLVAEGIPALEEFGGGEFDATPEAFGVSAVLCDPELVKVAQEAVEAAVTESFTASEIVVAFNSWKLSQGAIYSDSNAEGIALRAFAGDGALIAEHLEAAESGLFGSEAESADADEELAAVLARQDEWREAYDKAAAQRSRAEKQRSQATAGMTAAEDKFRQMMAVTSKHEEKARAIAQRDCADSLKRLEETACAERARIARELAQVNAQEKEAREAAERKLRESMDAVQGHSAKVISAAQADRTGALHKWRVLGKRAIGEINGAEEEMSRALMLARELADAARAAAEKREQSTVTAQAEAKALLELLRQTKEEAAQETSKALEEKRELEEAVEFANKRAKKAKLAAQQALEDL